jgi:hypothetical protein
MGPTALLSFRRKSCYGFLSPLKIHRHRPGLNPRTFGPMATTMTTRPPKTAFNIILQFGRKVWREEATLKTYEFHGCLNSFNLILLLTS